ncbi:MAG: signal recognition particle-docking protein FtsY [Pseudomonadota bacterium]
MFNFLKKETKNKSENINPSIDSNEDGYALDKKQGKKSKISLFSSLKKGLGKTRAILNTDIVELVSNKKTIDDDLLEDIESQLLMADIGVESTLKIIDDLNQRVEKKDLQNVDALFDALEVNMINILEQVSKPLLIDKSKSPYVILMVGINGAGKTTTIGKLAKRYQQQGLSVMLAAGDTFRAAAVEQLQVWGERNNIPVIAQHAGADSASVIYDAIEAGKARNIDIIIADTAGRLHTQSHLMDELSKVKRVAGKIDASAPHEVMLVLDAGTGQNAINQAEKFLETVGVTGITLTKLDGTAKGGIIFALAQKLHLPIRFIGVGESIDDLREFNSKDFVRALLARD